MFPEKEFVIALVALLQNVFGYATDLPGNLGIIDGHPISISDAPYMVALLNHVRLPDKEYLILCGASIIHERFLLTAAHCLLNHRSDLLVASMGSERYENSTNTLMEVEMLIPHKNFTYRTANSDIGLVKLKKPVPFGENIVKITLADRNFTIDAGTLVNVPGWGAVTDDMKAPPPLDLQAATIPVMSQQHCRDIARHVDDTVICAGVMGRGTCYGDSGGPLVFQQQDTYIQVGIVSRGSGDTCNGLDVYTRISSFDDWIQTNIAKNL